MATKPPSDGVRSSRLRSSSYLAFRRLDRTFALQESCNGQLVDSAKSAWSIELKHLQTLTCWEKLRRHQMRVWPARRLKARPSHVKVARRAAAARPPERTLARGRGFCARRRRQSPLPPPKYRTKGVFGLSQTHVSRRDTS